MSLTGALERISNEYAAATTQALKNHPVAPPESHGAMLKN
jgi:hypothetical protein